MVNASRAIRGRLATFSLARPGLTAQIRVVGMLVLLVTLFAGLQEILAEGGPRVEVRFVQQDVPVQVPVQVPVEVPVERVVERIVYVPVERVEGAEAHPADRPAEVAPASSDEVQPSATESEAVADAPADLADVPAEPAAPAPVAATVRPAAPRFVAPPPSVAYYVVEPEEQEADVEAQDEVVADAEAAPEEAAPEPEGEVAVERVVHEQTVLQDGNGAGDTAVPVAEATIVIKVAPSEADQVVAVEPEIVAAAPVDEATEAVADQEAAPGDEDTVADVEEPDDAVTAEAHDDATPADDEDVAYAKSQDGIASAAEEPADDEQAGAVDDEGPADQGDAAADSEPQEQLGDSDAGGSDIVLDESPS